MKSFRIIINFLNPYVLLTVCSRNKNMKAYFYIVIFYFTAPRITIKEKLKPISFYGLDTRDVIRAIMQVSPERLKELEEQERLESVKEKEEFRG